MHIVLSLFSFGFENLLNLNYTSAVYCFQQKKLWKSNAPFEVLRKTSKFKGLISPEQAKGDRSTATKKKERKGLEIASLLPVLCCCHANGFHTNLISDYDSALSCIVLFVLLSQLKVINNRLLCFWVILYWLVFFC